MVKVVWFRFQQCLIHVTMLLVEGQLKRNFLDVYLTTFFESVISEVDQLWGSSFFREYLKFDPDFKIAEKNGECLWFLGKLHLNLKLSLLRRIHLSLAVNMLTNILKTLHITKTDFFNSIAFTVINKYKKVGAVQISTVFCRTYHVACPRVLWNGIF